MAEQAHANEFTIIVNGREKHVSENELSFDQLVVLAFGTVQNNGRTVYTITYRHGEGNKHEGTLVEGQTVAIKNRMIFNVTPTDKS